MNKSDGFYSLTFSQREGKAALPEPMRLEHLSDDFRRSVWFHADQAIGKSSTLLGVAMDGNYRQSAFRSLIQRYLFEVVGQQHDTIDDRHDEHRDLLRVTILRMEYDAVLSLIEFLLRNTALESDPILSKLRKELEGIFDRVPVAYAVQTMQGLPTIIPRASQGSGDATMRAVEAVKQKGPEGAEAHFRDAAEHINAKRYADSIRESISAVESVARTIDPKASATLGPALTSLEKAGVLKHGVFKEALQKLYGYTNSEEGIRHCLMDEGKADVDLEEAVFMFSACAAFSAYLLNRRHSLLT